MGYQRHFGTRPSLELGHQMNLEETVSLAIKNLLAEPVFEEESSDEPIEEEWIDRWINVAKLASVTNARELWPAS